MKLIQKAVLKNGDKYLILLRSPKAPYFPLHWDLPGGTLEKNEDPLFGIIREVKEETALDIKPIEVVGVYEFDLKNAGTITHRFTLYSTETLSGELKISSEHIDQRWATKEEILQLPREPYFDLFLKKL